MAETNVVKLRIAYKTIFGSVQISNFSSIAAGIDHLNEIGDQVDYILRIQWRPSESSPDFVDVMKHRLAVDASPSIKPYPESFKRVVDSVLMKMTHVAETVS